jgi:nitrite reductase/ring-hydroxylating ferredoxin subunit
VEELPAGEAVTFTGLVRGEERLCFAVRVPGSNTDAKFAAFLNVCAHRNQPVVDSRFPFDEEQFVECRAHGARYEPLTGLCVEGPCVGAQLVQVTVEQIGDELYAVDDDVVDDSMYEE